MCGIRPAHACISAFWSELEKSGLDCFAASLEKGDARFMMAGADMRRGPKLCPKLCPGLQSLGEPASAPRALFLLASGERRLSSELDRRRPLPVRPGLRPSKVCRRSGSLPSVLWNTLVNQSMGVGLLPSAMQNAVTAHHARARRKKDSSDAPRSLGSRQNGEVAGGRRMID